MRLFTTSIMMFIFILSNSLSAEKNELVIEKILSTQINGSINPATLDYLSGAFKKVKNENFQALLIKINTPGGLVTTTKDILSQIGEANVPVIVWVTPEGASATSAGAIIASGAHFIYMSEGTNIGAATPVMMGKELEEKSDMRSKAVNDLVALVQSLSTSRGRDGNQFGKMISEAASFEAQKAFEQKLIDGIVSSEKQIFENLNSKIINIHGEKTQILTNDKTTVIVYEMSLGQYLLNILANPSMAYILFIIGAALIYLELQAPGGFIAGSIGAACLILAGIGFQVLPLNFGALGLIVLAFILFILEIYITSYGLLSLSGIISLIIGSLFLYRSEAGSLQLPVFLIASTVIVVGGFILFIGFILIRDWRKGTHKEFFTLKKRQGIISEVGLTIDGNHQYKVKVYGEVWTAVSSEKYQIGDHVQIVQEDREKMILTI